MTHQDIRGIVFDKDGTLIDFNDTWPPIFAAIAVELASAAGNPALAPIMLTGAGQDPDSGAVTAGSAIAEASFETLARFWCARHPEIGMTVLGAEENLGAWIRLRALEIANTPKPVTDLAALFSQLRNTGIAIGVATNDSTAGAQKLIDTFALSTHVDFVVGSDAGHGAKPDPGMILAFCRQTGITPAQTAMVGDSPADLNAGRAAGCGLVIGVLTGPGRTEDLAPLADHVIPDITGLVRIFEKRPAAAAPAP